MSSRRAEFNLDTLEAVAARASAPEIALWTLQSQVDIETGADMSVRGRRRLLVYQEQSLCREIGQLAALTFLGDIFDPSSTLVDSEAERIAEEHK